MMEPYRRRATVINADHSEAAAGQLSRAWRKNHTPQQFATDAGRVKAGAARSKTPLAQPDIFGVDFPPDRVQGSQ
jgi:hypothetical protein